MSDQTDVTTPEAPAVAPAADPAPVAEAPAAPALSIVPTPPPVAGEPPQDPDLLGTLSPEEIGNLTALRQRTGQLTMELGNIEIRKARIVSSLFQMEEQAQGILQNVGKRLNVPEGTQYQVLPDGSVRKVGLPPPPVPAP